ncbi:E3 ubiquitin-protein ligase MIB2-like isoform X2 [Gigantopelta aegis]|uniref:E3 ubiquitin-protein ligase MIB2-like isoform X2 n=1 Tax=Gigantopelta aegis TaxID=1735272 RepID=UPI001B88B350|nr:E3 ubiquitin-protein ligase MIB2-like isoform X2 [Gigantopelta aegis]
MNPDSGGPPELTEASKLAVGSIVRINSDQSRLRCLQKEHRAWSDEMQQVVGKVGRVTKIDSDGDLAVRFGSKTFSFNPACCLPASPSDLSLDPAWQGHSQTLGEKEEPLKLGDFTALSASKTSGVQLLQSLHSLPAEVVYSEVIKATEAGDVEAVKKFFESKPNLVNDIPDNTYKCLHLAAKNGKLEIVKFLVEKGFDKDSRDGSGNTTLLVAADQKHTDIVQFLIQSGADINISNDNDRSVLHTAAIKGQTALVHELMMRACDVNVMDSAGDTPLHDAIAKDETSCAEMLLTSPVIDLTIANERGFTLIHWAAFHGRERITQRILQRDPSLVNLTKDDGFTALHLAALNNRPAILRLLIAQGADVNLKTTDSGPAAIHLACHHDYVDCIEVLVSGDADINLVDDNENTALHLIMGETRDIFMHKGKTVKVEKKRRANMQVRSKLATYLVQHGADVNIKNKKGQTPFDLCNSKILKKAVSAALDGSVDSIPKATPMDTLLCCKCFERTADVTLPCNHKMTCSECSEGVTSCPLCGEAVSKPDSEDGQQIEET